MDNKLFSFRMIQEQLRKSKRYKYTNMYTFLQSNVHTNLGGGGGMMKQVILKNKVEANQMDYRRSWSLLNTCTCS